MLIELCVSFSQCENPKISPSRLAIDSKRESHLPLYSTDRAFELLLHIGEIDGAITIRRRAKMTAAAAIAIVTAAAAADDDFPFLSPQS